MLELKYIRTRDVYQPNRGTPGSAGIDFFVPFDLTPAELSKFYVDPVPVPEMEEFSDGTVGRITLKPGEKIMIPLGIKVKIPTGHCLKMENKSGVASKTGLVVGASIVDEDYQGVIHANLWNVSNTEVVINAGDKLVQGILYPVVISNIEEVENEDVLYSGNVTERGEGGFGSTGTKAE